MKKSLINLLGQRVLLKVKKFKVEEVEKFENSIIYKANVDTEKAKDETRFQTHAIVESLGSQAFLNPTLFPKGNPGVNVGDRVHFSRYGAKPIDLMHDDPDFEYWIVVDRDLLCVESEIEVADQLTEATV